MTLPADPALWVALVGGGRYLAIAGLLFLLCRAGLGHPVAGHAGEADRWQIGREIGCSLAMVGLLVLINGVLMFQCGLLQASRLYWHIAERGLPWFLLSIPVVLLLQDTLFYWTHRALHTRWLFRRVHRVHHASVHPTAWAAYSFHPVEAAVEILLVTSIVFLVPVHPLAMAVAQTLSMLFNAYGHCGREFLPPRARRWLNTSTAHSAHHRVGHGNYGLYLRFWDEAMGTTVPVVAGPDGPNRPSPQPA